MDSEKEKKKVTKKVSEKTTKKQNNKKLYILMLTILVLVVCGCLYTPVKNLFKKEEVINQEAVEENFKKVFEEDEMIIRFVYGVNRYVYINKDLTYYARDVIVPENGGEPYEKVIEGTITQKKLDELISIIDEAYANKGHATLRGVGNDRVIYNNKVLTNEQIPENLIEILNKM